MMNFVYNCQYSFYTHVNLLLSLRLGRTDGRTYNNDFTRCMIRKLTVSKNFTNLGVAIGDGVTIYTIYVHAIYNTVLLL